MKKYKDLTPAETINKVRSSLSKVNILVKEDHNANNDFFSCRISVANNSLSHFNIGTNGKGNSIEYALASGYAEFMERLQNKILFNHINFTTDRFLKTLPKNNAFASILKKNKLVLDFLFDRDEEYWPLDKVIDHCSNELLLLLNINNKNELSDYIRQEFGADHFLMIPFYSVSDQKTKYLPIELLQSTIGTNGQTAGNSFKEAFLQGLCEIFERYAVAEIYYKDIVPPTIPLSYFKDSQIYVKIKKIIEDKGYHVIIKDCSLNKELPVIGVIITDPSTRMYNFKLGADFVPERALERCLTEFYQNAYNFHGVEMDFSIFERPDIIDNFIYHNYLNIIGDGYGHWPSTIFSDNFSYGFDGFKAIYGNSDEFDIRKSIEIIHNMGLNIYIRDNSSLGFPAYYIVIPGLSQYSKNKEYVNKFKKSSSDFVYFNKLGRINKDDAKLLVSSINENYELIKFHKYNYIQNYLYNDSTDFANIPIDLLQFMLYYYIGDNINAKKYIDIFIQGKDRSAYSYYFAVSDFIYLRNMKGMNDVEVSSILENCYGAEMSGEVFRDLTNPDNIFQYNSFPTCFYCDDCRVSSSCSYIKVIELMKKINDYEKDHYIHQEKIKDKLDLLNGDD